MSVRKGTNPKHIVDYVSSLAMVPSGTYNLWRYANLVGVLQLIYLSLIVISILNYFRKVVGYYERLS